MWLYSIVRFSEFELMIGNWKIYNLSWDRDCTIFLYLNLFLLSVGAILIIFKFTVTIRLVRDMCWFYLDSESTFYPLYVTMNKVSGSRLPEIVYYLKQKTSRTTTNSCKMGVDLSLKQRFQRHVVILPWLGEHILHSVCEHERSMAASFHPRVQSTV